MPASIVVTQDIRRVELVLRPLGVRGATGPSGASAEMEITGLVDTASELPTASDYTTKFFLARDTGVIYFSDGTDWIIVNLSYTGIPGWEIVEDLPADPNPDVLYFVPEPA
jgi:hypothetical protein